MTKREWRDIKRIAKEIETQAKRLDLHAQEAEACAMLNQFHARGAEFKEDALALNLAYREIKALATMLVNVATDRLNTKRPRRAKTEGEPDA